MVQDNSIKDIIPNPFERVLFHIAWFLYGKRKLNKRLKYLEALGLVEIVGTKARISSKGLACAKYLRKQG